MKNGKFLKENSIYREQNMKRPYGRRTEHDENKGTEKA